MQRVQQLLWVLVALLLCTAEPSAQQRRYVLRIPANWNGALVLGAHGGSSGNAVDRSGNVYATSETALDDVIGRYAFDNGFAYASVDRDGVGSGGEAWRHRPEFHGKAFGAGHRSGGNLDDLVIREIRTYAQRVDQKDRHRLYEVEGVWHMSGDDDGVQGFQFNAESRMKLDKDVADAMGESPSYIPAVRESLDYLVRWVEKMAPPPASQTVKPGQTLRP